MHDVDYPYGKQMEGESFTYEFEGGGPHSMGAGEVFGENELNELATELLEVGSDHELEQFLGNIIKKVGSAVGKVVKSPLGQSLGGMLKGLAKQALPVVGSALGNFVVPGVGGAVGGKLASMAGQALGLELEGLSMEDREFETAKQFARIAADAAHTALTAPEGAPPQRVASAAVQQALQKFAPDRGSLGSETRSGGQSGRWVRKGNKIILYGI